MYFFMAKPKNFSCGLPDITIAPHLSRVGVLVSELLVDSIKANQQTRTNHINLTVHQDIQLMEKHF